MKFSLPDPGERSDWNQELVPVTDVSFVLHLNFLNSGVEFDNFL